MVNYNGQAYEDNAPIDWDVAIDIVGYYFERVRYLGLPKPPACFTFDNPNPTDEQLKIIGQYHELFNAAELCDVPNVDVFNQLPKSSIN